MSNRTDRRDFLKTGALAGLGFWVTGPSAFAQGKGPNDKLNIACVGVGGKGATDLDGVARTENIVAICDIDEEPLDKAAAKYPMARKYYDWRKLLDEAKDIDAVTVSTPDHSHAIVASSAMKLGKHVFCQKPLTRSVWEARSLGQTARKMKVATQMGNQGHAGDGVRRTAEVIQSGAVGPIREVYCWTDRPIWPQGMTEPAGEVPCPSSIHWDVFLGPAPSRAYNPAYHPFKWRGWWDFGTGSLGDMACHVMDPVFWALNLCPPTRVSAEGPPPSSQGAPKQFHVTWEFPARGAMPPVKVHWMDAGQLPPDELFQGARKQDNGVLFLGDKGTLYIPATYGERRILLPTEQYKDYMPPAATIAGSPGVYAEWVQAAKTGGQAGSNFPDYSGPMSETILLGNVAYRVGKPITWDSGNLSCPGCPEADQYLHPEFRKGWEI